MTNTPSSPPKPRRTTIRPEITRLPRLTVWRRMFRGVLRWLARLVVWGCTRMEVSGLEHIPLEGPALVATNHLGDADAILGLAFSPVPMEAIAKAELYDFPLLGKLMAAYGVIWVHRGEPDRRALRVALQGLAEGRLVAIAPEGRQSVTGSLEEGASGASYLAYKAGVPILPITFTGTENARVYDNLKHFRRSDVSMTVGPAFWLDNHPDWRQAIQHGTRKIMHRLASQLPQEYRGVYGNKPEFDPTNCVEKAPVEIRKGKSP